MVQMLDFFHARSSESCCWSIFSNRMYGQSILLLVFNKWQLLLVCMCARNSAKGGYSNRQEPTLSFGGKTKFLCHMRYEGKYKLHSIIGTVHYFLGPFLTVHSNGSVMAVIIPWNLKSEAP